MTTFTSMDMTSWFRTTQRTRVVSASWPHHSWACGKLATRGASWVKCKSWEFFLIQIGIFSQQSGIGGTMKYIWNHPLEEWRAVVVHLFFICFFLHVASIFWQQAAAFFPQYQQQISTGIYQKTNRTPASIKNRKPVEEMPRSKTSNKHWKNSVLPHHPWGNLHPPHPPAWTHELLQASSGLMELMALLGLALTRLSGGLGSRKPLGVHMISMGGSMVVSPNGCFTMENDLW